MQKQSNEENRKSEKNCKNAKKMQKKGRKKSKKKHEDAKMQNKCKKLNPHALCACFPSCNMM